jgi:carbon-monoxide dehydrogenase medium subunit
VLAAGGPDARLLAGGQSLMPMLNFRVAAPSLVIDINRVPGLDAVEDDGGIVRIGALVRHAALECSKTIARHIPLIREVMPHVAHAAIRSRGTIGGSLALADPAAELPACMLALDATIVVRSVKAEHRVSASDFFLGVYETALAADEMIVAVEIPKQGGRRHAFREIARRHGDYAMVGVALTAAAGEPIADPRIVVFGVADRPVRATQAEAAITGLATGAEAGGRAAAALDGALQPHGDQNASPEMKLHLAKVLLRRTIRDLAGGTA